MNVLVKVHFDQLLHPSIIKLHGASGIARLITRFILSNSCIKLDLFCKRPAVSQIKISTPLFFTLIASYTTVEGQNLRFGSQLQHQHVLPRFNC